MSPPPQTRTGWRWWHWLVSGIVLILLIDTLIPCSCRITVKANQMKAASNSRQIVALLLTYASDYGDHYTDHGLDLTQVTSNEAFRRLVQEGWVPDETIFGCPGSRFMPDKNLGTAPDNDQALISGENHWMMVAGLSPTSPSYYPVVLENTVDLSWPPRWWADKELKPVRGRAWPKDGIVVAFNDASVETVKLDRKGEYLHLPKRILAPGGKKPLPPMTMLDIEVAGKGDYSYGSLPGLPPTK
ncbi:hypothetical protein SAMN02745166_03104 [Prosthecobacter debontii]|uniref:Type II secretory pathway, pseudopilin PulG n=1 Tax=Prosthecobacter debontii TaxID=48467 RepID=A0A1T4YES1_9BACT|nr:hypothetical protein [Prosthecobacter debontii]SKB00254.1 hypothetical protein SAMN02745166_03104 [Prosthecobacter debontii]